ncbi:MAG: DNA replication/repair protein RecF [Alphaproteobacteria bacterium]|nr:DNA replication/repair protein RecF [Alphaproteobacteria bacterium]
MSFISSLKLHNFRCYDSAALEDLPGGLIVLYGPNGAGKTNVLEAVSLLSPGRGLRGVTNIEMQQQSAAKPWAVSAIIQSSLTQVQIGTGLDPATEKRIVRIQGQPVKAQAALADYLACVWVTPQMDRLFIDSSSHRRRFLDRLVFAFDPGHAGRVTRYENALAQRSKLLREGKNEPAWLESLEAQAAETGIAIAAARLEFVQRLQSGCDAESTEFFPRARLEIRGTVETLLHNSTALETEQMFVYQLRASRERDAVTGGAATGPHKSDLSVVYAAKDMPADQCSTGEQKALLIGIILAHARLIRAERGAAPVLLLDEVAAHLDRHRRAALYDILQQTGGQAWLTGTDENLFSSLRGSAQFFEVREARIISPDVIPSGAPQARSRGI